MTSIADPVRSARGPSWARTLIVAALLGLLSAETPGAWAVLWLAVPVVTAAAMLVAWRFGWPGLLLPVLAAGGALVAGREGALWAWWIPAAALSGAWTGLREEGGRNTSGARAWRLAPVLALAAALPLLPGWSGFVSKVEADLTDGDRELITMSKQFGYSGDRLARLQRDVDENARVRRGALPQLLPSALFLWMALLVGTGRTFAARAARSLGWPALTRTPLTQWRVPDGVLWSFLVGLAALVLAWSPAVPSGWTLLIGAGLGFCVQGIAVVGALLVSRGVPTGLITLTMLFMFAVAMPVFVVTAAALGLSDAWLDYRRLEPADDGGERLGE